MWFSVAILVVLASLHNGVESQPLDSVQALVNQPGLGLVVSATSVQKESGDGIIQSSNAPIGSILPIGPPLIQQEAVLTRLRRASSAAAAAAAAAAASDGRSSATATAAAAAAAASK